MAAGAGSSRKVKRQNVSAVSIYDWDGKCSGSHRDTIKLTRDEEQLARRIREALRLPCVCYGSARVVTVEGQQLLIVTRHL